MRVIILDFNMEYMAKTLSVLSNLPVKLYIGNNLAASHKLTEYIPEPNTDDLDAMLSISENTSYHIAGDFAFYGVFRIGFVNAIFIIGPTMQMRPNDNQLRQLLKHNGESQSNIEKIRYYFSRTPCYPLDHFLQIICTLNYFINNEELSPNDILIRKELPRLPEVNEEERQNYITDKETREYDAAENENIIASYIEYGNMNELNKYLEFSHPCKIGNLAADGLRQVKNVFICMTTVAKRAAVRGGLDSDTAYITAELYIRKCEAMLGTASVTALMNEMLKDYCIRVSALNTFDGKLANRVQSYITKHIHDQIHIRDIAEELKISPSYLCDKFKKETGMTINRLVTKLKINEACRLLMSTDKTIAEISSLLDFSSQSYFQKCFKAETGVTPAKYKENKTTLHEAIR